MGGMRGPGLSMRAEGGARGRSARMGQADLPKRKPSLRKIGPQIWTLIAPRKGLIVGGLLLMAVNRLAGLVLPLVSKPLLDKVLSAAHPVPGFCPKSSRRCSRPPWCRPSRHTPSPSSSPWPARN